MYAVTEKDCRARVGYIAKKGLCPPFAYYFHAASVRALSIA